MLTSLAKALTPRLPTEYVPHHPTPRQQAFLLLPHREVLFGGSAGGGKTDALLMAALQYVDVPGYAALLLRRTFRQLALEESLLDRAAEWLAGTQAKWRATEYRWTFPSGATLSFGYLDREADKYNYQSAAYQFIGWDELTQWPNDAAYRYLFSRLRKLSTPEMQGVPERVRAGTNPGGLGHEWVSQRFRLTHRSKEMGPLPKDRLFLRSTLDDNPHLDRESYEQALKELGTLDYLQLRRGDWEARQEGEMLKRVWFPLLEETPPSLVWCRYWDLAGTEPNPDNPDPDWTRGALVGLDRASGEWFIEDMASMRATSGAVDDYMRQTAMLDRQRFGHVAIRVEQEPGSSGQKVIADLRRQVFTGFDFDGNRPGTDKVTRARPLASAAESGLVRAKIAPWTDGLLSEFEAFPSAGVHDDQVDAVTGAMAHLAFGVSGRGGLRS